MQSFKKRSRAPLRSRARSKRTLPFAFVLIFVGIVAAASAQQPAPAVLNAKAPELEERPAHEWLNSPPLKLSNLRGQVVVLHFWTFGCINCHHNDSAYKAWHQKYSGKGVTMIGVHTPETERERDPKRLKRSIEERGLRYPIVVDRDGK